MCWLLPSCPVRVSWSWWCRINHSEVLGCLPDRQVWESAWFVFCARTPSLPSWESSSLFVSFPVGSLRADSRLGQNSENSRRSPHVGANYFGQWVFRVLMCLWDVPPKVMVSSLLQRRFSRRCRCRHLSTHRIQMVPHFLRLRVTFCALRPLSVWVSGKKVSLLLS